MIEGMDWYENHICIYYYFSAVILIVLLAVVLPIATRNYSIVKRKILSVISILLGIGVLISGQKSIDHYEYSWVFGSRYNDVSSNLVFLQGIVILTYIIIVCRGIPSKIYKGISLVLWILNIISCISCMYILKYTQISISYVNVIEFNVTAMTAVILWIMFIASITHREGSVQISLCPECGERVLEGLNFCKKCGAPLKKKK